VNDFPDDQLQRIGLAIINAEYPGEPPSAWDDLTGEGQELALRQASAALMEMAAAPAPAPNAVRVRIPVHWVGECHAVHWYGEDRHGPALDKLTESPIIAYITADIPLPQPVEVKGEVE